jgi:hypothetical protein
MYVCEWHYPCLDLAARAGYLVGVQNIDVVGGLIAGAIVASHPFRGHIFWHLG